MAYEVRISDWSSDVCSSDLYLRARHGRILRPWLTWSVILYGKIGEPFRYGQTDRERPRQPTTPSTSLSFMMIRSSPSSLPSLPDHLPNRILSPALPSSGVIVPSSERIPLPRSEERRVGKECVRTCQDRWAAEQ